MGNSEKDLNKTLGVDVECEVQKEFVPPPPNYPPPSNTETPYGPPESDELSDNDIKRSLKYKEFTPASTKDINGENN